MTRHLNGPLLLGYDVKHGKTTSTISSFQERKEAIVSCLRVSVSARKSFHQGD